MTDDLLIAPQLIRCPVCWREPRCGEKRLVTLGLIVRVSDDCENQDLRCQCGRTGVLSTNLRLTRPSEFL